MPTFPKTKNEIMILAAKIADGIMNHPADYPNPPFDDVRLHTLLGEVIGLISDRQAKEAAAKDALEAENEKIFDEIAVEARHQLRLAEDKYEDDAGKLGEIGWAPKGAPKYYAPGQVRTLHAASAGPGAAALDWKAPEASASVGDVRYYRIERQLTDIASRVVTELWGTWNEVTTETHTVLHGQPRAVEISYRVKAVNPNGEGQPSDTETVVL